VSDTGHKARGDQLASISTGIVQLHHRCYGRGPTEAKTYAVDDTILCILKGGFTTMEKTLMADGKVGEVESIRRSFQETMEEQFVGVVQQTLDREVIGYMTQVHTDPDVAIELFLLAPAGEPLRGEHKLVLDDGGTGDGPPD
jgi:uncharacterized protein YbcI